MRAGDVGNAMTGIEWSEELKPLSYIYTVLYMILISTILLNVRLTLASALLYARLDADVHSGLG